MIEKYYFVMSLLTTSLKTTANGKTPLIVKGQAFENHLYNMYDLFISVMIVKLISNS